jgi:hypothetical protein
MGPAFCSGHFIESTGPVLLKTFGVRHCLTDALPFTHTSGAGGSLNKFNIASGFDKLFHFGLAGMIAAHCSLVLKPMGDDRLVSASLNKDGGANVFTSNAPFQVADLVSDWSDLWGVVFELIEVCGDVCFICDVGTTVGFLPREYGKGGIFILGSGQEVSNCSKDMGIGVGGGLFVGNWNGQADAQDCHGVRHNVASGFLGTFGVAFLCLG